MAPEKNLALVFRKIPSGFPKPGEDLVVEDLGPFDIEKTEAPSDGGVVLQMLYGSFDPYLRGLLRAKEKESYFNALDLGQPIRNGSVGRVLKSSSPDLKPGDIVKAYLPFQQYHVISAADASKLQKVDTADGPEDLRHYLGALGMPGLTAYSSYYEIGQPKRGETIFVSSAAGAVGQLVGQLAKRDGLTVIGSVGSDEKLAFLIDELGFDSGFNYKKERPKDALARLAPKGIDIYYENVGGEHLEAAIDAMNTFGRIVLSGMISQYNIKDPAQRYPIRNTMMLVGKQITMRGFIVNSNPDCGPKYRDEHQRNVKKWLKDGTLTAKVHEFEMEKADEGFVGMLNGVNFGKAVLKVS